MLRRHRKIIVFGESQLLLVNQVFLKLHLGLLFDLLAKLEAIVLQKNKLMAVSSRMLERVQSLHILLLVPEADALQVAISILLSPLDEEFVVQLIQLLFYIFVVGLLENEHPASQNGE